MEDLFGEALPDTLGQITPSGGRHWLFRWPERAIPNSSRAKCGPGLDTRGEGGYILVAPSIHPNGKRYVWTADPDSTAIAPAPEWLVRLVIGAPDDLEWLRRALDGKALPAWLAKRLSVPKAPADAERAGPPPGSIHPYARKALEEEAQKVRTAVPGSRNSTLNEAAFNLGQFIPGGYLPRSLIEQHLSVAALACFGSDQRELIAAQKTIKSGLDGGMQHPRELPAPLVPQRRGRSGRPAPRRPLRTAAEDPQTVAAAVASARALWADGQRVDAVPGALAFLRAANAVRSWSMLRAVAGLDPAPAMRLLGQQLESILVGVGDGIDGLQKLTETAAILREMGEDTGALWASTRAEHVRAAVNQDLSMRELAAKVALGQASQAAYDMAELEIRQRQELADVTDAAVRARLIEVQATEKAAAVAKAAAQATAELTAKQQALISAGGDTRKWLDQRAGTASTSVSPEEALQAAQAQFARDLSLARGGDADASRRITDTADRLLAATDAVHASGAEYQAMERWVTSSIAGLPATVSYDQQILAALRELGGSVNVQVELTTVRAITESLNALSEEERNRLTQTAVILRTVEERLGQLLSSADLARLVDAELVTRDIQQVLGRDLSSVERDALVAGGSVVRSVEQAIGRALTAAEVATIIQGGTVDRSIVQAMGRTLTAAEAAALVQAGAVVRSIGQYLGRDLSFSEADALVVGGAVVRTVGQYLGRDLTVEERAGLVAAARVIRTVEQQLGRPLTDAEQAAIILPASVTRTIGQTVNPATGSTLITSGTETKTVKQSVETTETVQISRSMDDKLSGILTAIKVATEASSKLLESVRALVERAVDGDGLMVRTRPTSDPRSWVAFERGGVIPGYEAGGTVANGVRGKDSVLARYPDGRPIWLAGGEFVTPEPAVTPETYPMLEYIRQHHALPPPASGYEAGGAVAPQGFADLDSRVPVPRRLIEAPAAVAARLDVQPVVGAITALTVAVGLLREDVVDLGRADHDQRAALSGAVDRRLVAMADVLDTVARRVGGR